MHQEQAQHRTQLTWAASFLGEYRFQSFEVGIGNHSAAPFAADAKTGAEGSAASTRYGTEAGFSLLKQACVFTEFAFHADGDLRNHRHASKAKRLYRSDEFLTIDRTTG